MLSTKSLLNKRLLKNPLKKVFPSKQQGNDGDLQLARISGKGEFLLGKIDGNWFSTKLTSIKDSSVNKSKKIKTSKLYGLGGLALTLVSESISTSIYTGKTATSKTNSQPILKIGNGKNTGIVSSLGNQDLLLTTGNSTSSYLSITDGSNGSITSVLNGSGKFDIIFNSSDADDPRVRVLNVGTGCSSLDLTVSTSTADSYVSYGYRADDPSNNRYYVTGIDNTNPNSYNINFTSGSSSPNLTPSNGTNLVKISNDGDMTLLKDLFVTGDATVDGGRLDIDKSSGDPKLVFQIGGTSKFTLGLDDSDSDKFKINSGSTIGDSSDLELDSSGNFSVAGTLTIGDINTDTAGDNYLVEVSGEVKKRTPAQVLSDIGAQASGSYITGSGSLSAQDLTDISNLSGTNTGDQVIPDNYLRDNADDTTSGTITAAGFTTTGTWTFDDATSGTVGITTVHTGSSFADNDTSLMTAGAIKEKIEDYGYITTAGDIDRVKFTTDSGNHSITTGNADWTISGGEGIDTSISTSTITIAAEEASSINKGVASFSTDNFSVSSGNVTIKDLGVATDELDNRAVTYAKMQNVTNARMLGNNSGLAASPSEMTQANVLSFLGVEAGATADQTQSDINGLAITTVGTIDTGTWEGTTIAVDQGGTGATSLDNLITLGTHTTGNYVSTLTAGALIDLQNNTGEGATPTIDVDLTELTDGTADVVGSADELVYLDDGVQKRKQIDEIKLGQFNNDQGWTTNTGTISWDGSTANGIATYKDADEATVESNLTFDGTDLSIAGTGKLILGADDTFIHESASDVLNFTVANNNMMLLSHNGSSGTIEFNNCSTGILIPSATKLYFDGGTSTHISESSADNMRFTVGNDTVLDLTEEDTGTTINMGTSAAGFTRSTYADATNVTVDFRTGNKAHLDMTGGSIGGTLTLQFPAVSGNFVLVVQQDGSTRTINAYATKDAAGNAGNNDGGTAGAVRWAGGSVPDLTDGNNKRDILSFYWDATEEVCYGVASLDF